MFHSTTILAIHQPESLVFVGDGQVSLGNTVVKQGAVKVRKLTSHNVLAGFAGSAADAFTLFERFEAKINEHRGQLMRAAVELAKDWRNDKFLRRLEAMMLVGNKEGIFLLSGAGDVIQPDDGIASIGSGGNYALAAARGIVKITKDKNIPISAKEIALASMQIASEICVFTNNNFSVEETKF